MAPYPADITPEEVLNANCPAELRSQLFPDRRPDIAKKVPAKRSPAAGEPTDIAGPCEFCSSHLGFRYGPDEVIVCPDCLESGVRGQQAGLLDGAWDAMESAEANSGFAA